MPVKGSMPQESNPQIFLNLPDPDPTLCLLNPSTYLDLQTSTLTLNFSSKTNFDRIMGNFLNSKDMSQIHGKFLKFQGHVSDSWEIS